MPLLRPLFLLFGLLAAAASGASGDLDLTFNSTGIRTLSGNTGTTASVAVQADGKILLAGTGTIGSAYYDFAVYRVNADGSSDQTFGTLGSVRTAFGLSTDNVPHCIVVTPEGKILVGGSTTAGLTKYALARYNPDGSLDTSFGTGGKVITNPSAGSFSYNAIVALAVLPDGKIVAACHASGYPTDDFTLLRYHADGTLDATFGDNGMVETDITLDSSDLASGLVIQGDGKILITGRTTPYNTSVNKTELALVRYNSDGSLDNTFGSGGKVTVPVAGKPLHGRCVFLQRDERIVVVGTVHLSSECQIAVMRFTRYGALDTSFGTSGKTFTPVPVAAPGSVGFSLAAALQKDDRIVVATNQTGSGEDFAVLRYTAKGFPDSGFGADGKVTTSPGSTDGYSEAVALQKDGKILLAGRSGLNFHLVRYQNSLAPTVLTLPASDVTGTTATLHAFVNANENAGGGTSSASFKFGTGIAWTEWGTGPPWITGSADTPVSATITDLIPGTDYYFYVQSTGPRGTSLANILEFTTLPLHSNADLSSLTLSTGTLSPAFAAGQLNYTATVPYTTTSITLTPTVANRHATVLVNGFAVATGTASSPLALPIGPSLISIAVTAQDGTVKTYTVTVTRIPPAPGQADLSFNGTGQTIIDLAGDANDSTDFARDVVLLQDGKIFAVGYIGNIDDNRDFSAIRCHPDGSLDNTFGTGGTVVTPIGTKGDWAEAAAQQPDGKLIVAGHTQSAAGIDFAVVRYLSDGTLDPSFGTGGKTVTAVTALDDRCYGLLVQPDGKIVLVGSANTGADVALVRYHGDGTLDAGFGTGGIVLTALTADTDSANDVALQADGKLVIASEAAGEFAVLRYNTNGSLDKTFGAAGKALVRFNKTDHGNTLAIQEDGKIVIAGTTYLDGSDRDFALARLNANGSLDTSFGVGGRVVTEFGTDREWAEDIAIQQDGRIVVTGTSENFFESAFAIVTLCYFPNGSLDTGFGTAGIVAHFIDDAYSGGASMALEPDGDIVVLSTNSGMWTGYDFLLLRYHGLPYKPEIAVLAPGNLGLADAATWTIPAADVGLTKNISFQLRNVGSVELKDISLSLGGPNASLFSIITPPVDLVAPGQGSAFVIRYAPGATGSHTATLQITSNDADESPFDIILKGSGVNPRALPVKTLAATAIAPTSATLNGSIEPRNSDPTVWFDYGLTANYGATLAITPSVVNGDAPTQVSATLTGLLPHTKYHYRLRSLGALGESTASGLTFTTATTPPVAVNDTFAVVPSGAVTLNVLGNDSDADGDALTLVSTTSVPAAKGKLTKSNNQLIFTPASAFDGASFQYTVKDSFGGAATATVTLTAAVASIDPPTKDISSAGVTYNIAVTATGLWSIVENLPWVSATQTAPGTAQITIQPNSAKASRSGAITIAGQSHLITQAGVIAPTISAPSLIPPAIVSGSYNLVIPTTNPPVTYTATNLPPGLTIDQTTGVIAGKPTKAGDYTVGIKAKNAAGSAPTPVEIEIDVAPLPDGVIGAYHGYFTGAPMLSGFLSYRFELTTTATGSLSGKLIGAGKTWPFKGTLNADPDAPDHPHCDLTISRAGSTSLGFIAAFDATTDTLTGNIFTGDMGGTGQVDAWRQIWKPVTKPATAFKGAHSFYLDPPSDDPDLPQGRGFASFTVDEKTGALKVTGTLADGNSITSATFLGPQGQVLIHQPLYTNAGIFGGVLTVANDNTITGPLTWYKPTSANNSRDTLYRGGFGPVDYAAVGRLLPIVPPGGILMGLPDTAGNATLTFTSGALTPAEAFSQPLYLRNPSAAGLTNKAQFRDPNPNKVTLPTITPATGLFSGDFTLPGATTATNRKATFQGQIVEDDDGIQGHGFFLLSEPTLPPQTPATTPKHSGRVLLYPTGP